MKMSLPTWCIVLGLLAVFWFVPSCSKKKASAAADLSQAQISFSDGLGPLRFGESEESIIQLLGPPDARQGRVLSYSRLGFDVFLGRDMRVTVIGAGSARSVAEAETFKGRTPEGIGIGSTKEEVIAAYGQPTATRQKRQGNGADEGLEELVYRERHLKFTLRNGKVVLIFWGNSDNAMFR